MKRDISEYEKEATAYDDPCIHVRDAACEECMHISLFPDSGRVTRFRIRRLKPKGIE